jgi:hypothetical protein
MEALACALIMSALACFARGHLKWSWVLGAAALFTKETALALPLLIFGIALLQSSEKRAESFTVRLRNALLAATPCLMTTGVFLVVRWLVVPRTPSGATRAVIQRWPEIPAGIAHYLKFLVWPWPLAIHYELPGLHLQILAFLAIAGWLIAAGYVSRRVMFPVSGAISS